MFAKYFYNDTIVYAPPPLATSFCVSKWHSLFRDPINVCSIVWNDTIVYAPPSPTPFWRFTAIPSMFAKYFYNDTIVYAPPLWPPLFVLASGIRFSAIPSMFAE